jgi:tetratricopeptide (TPR) repeat protein
MTTQQQGQRPDLPQKHRSKRPLWTRWLIASVILLFMVVGTIIWILSSRSTFTSILPIVIFTILGVLIALFQWLFPVSSGVSEHPSTHQHALQVPPIIVHVPTTQPLPSAPPIQPTMPSERPYHNLFQPDYTLFIGRRKELKWLRRHLTSKAKVWQMVITGIGGVGKSALALAIAHEYHIRYNELPPEERFEAIIWITAKEEVLTIEGKEKSSLSGLIFHTLEDIYTAIAQTLEREDITRALPENQDALVQKALGAQRTLLIFDNLESVIDDRVRTFLNHLPVSTKCIITSREWVESNAVLRLLGLSLEEAKKLITTESEARVVKMNDSQSQRLFLRTAGLPLTIKLSAARMDSGETFEQVLRWLGKATGDLPEYCVKGQIAIVQVRNLNAWKILLTCSLFDQEAGISRDALGIIADVSLEERDDGLTLLQRLSLLNRDEDDRFWILPMVQEYLEVELENADYGKTLTESWLNWSVEFTQKYAVDLDLHVEEAHTIGLEYPHLLHAIRWCQKHEQLELLLQLVENTWFYPYLAGLFGELREMLEAGLQATKSMQSEQREGRLLRRLGRLLWVQGQNDKTLKTCLENAQAIALRYDDDKELGLVSDTLSDILYRSGDMLTAEQLAVKVLENGERLNDLELKILAAYRLSVFESNKHHFEEALEWLDRREQWCRELKWSRALAWTLYRRGTTLIEQGNTTLADVPLKQSLEMATPWNDRHLIARNQLSLALVFAATGQFPNALQAAENACDLYERLGMTGKLAEANAILQQLQDSA